MDEVFGANWAVALVSAARKLSTREQTEPRILALMAIDAGRRRVRKAQRRARRTERLHRKR